MLDRYTVERRLKTTKWFIVKPEDVDSDIWSIKDLMQYQLLKSGYHLKYANGHIKKDSYLVFQAIRNNPSALQFADPSILSNGALIRSFIKSGVAIEQFYMGDITAEELDVALWNFPECFIYIKPGKRLAPRIIKEENKSNKDTSRKIKECAPRHHPRLKAIIKSRKCGISKDSAFILNSYFKHAETISDETILRQTVLKEVKYRLSFELDSKGLSMLLHKYLKGAKNESTD